MNAARRFILAHRRSLAAVFAGLAVLSALTALRPAPSGEIVVIARHDLGSGTTIKAGDLRTARMDVRPAHALTSIDELVGRRIAAPMREGEPVTDYRLLEPSLIDGYGDGKVLATVEVADAGRLAGLRIGGFVDVIGTDPSGEGEATVLARRAKIAALPRGDDHETVALIVSERAGLDLATAETRARLTVLSVPRPATASR